MNRNEPRKLPSYHWGRVVGLKFLTISVALFLSSCLAQMSKDQVELAAELGRKSTVSRLRLISISDNRRTEYWFDGSASIASVEFTDLSLQSTRTTPDGLHVVAWYNDKVFDNVAFRLTRDKAGIIVFDSQLREAKRWEGHAFAYQIAATNDTRKIAFQGEEGLFLLADTKDLIALDPDAGKDHFRSFSPVGDRLVYERDGKILIYDLKSKRASELVTGLHPTWSPDGKWIAYHDAADHGILITPDGKKTETIVGNRKLAGSMRWSPDGEYLLYAEKDVKENAIWALSLSPDMSGRMWIRGVKDGVDFNVRRAIPPTVAEFFHWIVRGADPK